MLCSLREFYDESMAWCCLRGFWMPQVQGTSVHRVAVADVRATGQALGDGEGDMGQKYAKRSSSVRRSLQRFFPCFFQPGLPVTNRCVPQTCAVT